MNDPLEKTAQRAGDPLLKIGDLSELYGVAVRTVRRWIEEGRHPAPDYRINARVIRWHRSTAEKFLQRCLKK